MLSLLAVVAAAATHQKRGLERLRGGGVRHPSVCALVGTVAHPLAVALEFCARGNLMAALADHPGALAWHRAGKRVAKQVANHSSSLL